MSYSNESRNMPEIMNAEKANHSEANLPHPFFIVGSGRSGTTLLQSLLNKHSFVSIPPETQFFTKGRRAAGDALKNNRVKKRDLFLKRLRTVQYMKNLEPFFQQTRLVKKGNDSLNDFCRDLFLAYSASKGKILWGEKTPHHLWYWRRIHHLFPEACFLVMVRDGRDVALSLSETPWAPDNIYTNAYRWKHECRIRERLCNSLGKDLALTIHYEDLVTETEKTLRKVTDFLGLDFEESMLEDHPGNNEVIHDHEWAWKHRNVSKITASRIGRSRETLRDGLFRRLTTMLKKELNALGYDDSDSSIGGLWGELYRILLSIYAGFLFYGSYGTRFCHHLLNAGILAHTSKA